MGGALPRLRVRSSTVADYEKGRLLGRGGQGEVSLATRRGGGLVALKRLRPDRTTSEAIARLRAEGEFLRSVDHPNVLQCDGLTVLDGAEHLVLEYVDGVSLRQLLEAGQLDEGVAALVCLCAARGLAAIHDRGGVHRDVAPANILVSRTGDVKLADAGVVKVPGLTPETRESTVLGRDGFRATEYQERGELGPTADVYSLGVTIGRCAEVAGSEALASLARYAEADVEERPDLSDVIEELDTLVGGASEVRARLGALVESIAGPPAQEFSSVSATVLTRPPPHWRAPLTVGFLLGLVGVVVAMVGSDGSRDAEPTNRDSTPAPAVSVTPKPEPTSEPATQLPVTPASRGDAPTQRGERTTTPEFVTRDPRGWAPRTGSTRSATSSPEVGGMARAQTAGLAPEGAEPKDDVEPPVPALAPSAAEAAQPTSTPPPTTPPAGPAFRVRVADGANFQGNIVQTTGNVRITE